VAVIFFIESLLRQEKAMTITGNLVMKEITTIALEYIKANTRVGINPEALTKQYITCS
jgi:ATP-dependent Lon protease